MKKFYILSLVLSAILFFSCGTKKIDYTPVNDKDVKKTDDAIKFTNKEVVKSYKDCKPGTEKCTYIKLNYIEATEGKIKDKVNQLINRDLLFAYDMPDQNYKNVDDMLNIFMRDYETFRREVPAAPQVWTLDMSIKAYSETDKILCLSSELSAYLGGAHPNSSKVFYNIDKQTGDTLSLANLLKPGFETKLNELIDKKYRETRGLKPGDNLAEKGDLFENKIQFNNNFAVTKDKELEFVYNPYEIAPYAVGPITVKLSRSELEELIPSNSLLK
jgi:hypothetical protein